MGQNLRDELVIPETSPIGPFSNAMTLTGRLAGVLPLDSGRRVDIPGTGIVTLLSLARSSAGSCIIVYMHVR